ncbi:MAG: hypothetical protein AAFV19_07625 [Pseudomonadota bacterium]
MAYGFTSSAILIATFILLRDVVEDQVGRRVPGLVWWKRFLLEFAIVLPVMACVTLVLPKSPDEAFSVGGMITGVVIGMMASWAYSYCMKARPK